MAFLGKGIKEDLKTLAVELGLEVRPDFRIVELKKLILEDENYDEEFCKELFNTIINTRKDEMEENRRKEEIEEKRKKDEMEENRRKEELEEMRRKDEMEAEEKRRKDEMEVEEKRRKGETGAEEKRRQHEIEKLKLQAESIKQGGSQEEHDRSANKDFRNVIQKFNMKDNISLYFVLFERQARRVSLPKGEWVTQLLGLLPYEVNRSLAWEDWEMDEYEKVKELLLKRFAWTPEKYRLLFASHQKSQNGTWRDFYYDISMYFYGWLSALKISTFEQLRGLIIADQIKKRAPSDFREYYMEKWDDFTSPEMLAEKLDAYEDFKRPPKVHMNFERDRVWSQKTPARNIGGSSWRNKNINGDQKFQKPRMIPKFETEDSKFKFKPTCFKCGAEGHYSSFCRKVSQKPPNSVESNAFQKEKAALEKDIKSLPENLVSNACEKDRLTWKPLEKKEKAELEIKLRQDLSHEFSVLSDELLEKQRQSFAEEREVLRKSYEKRMSAMKKMYEEIIADFKLRLEEDDSNKYEKLEAVEAKDVVAGVSEQSVMCEDTKKYDVKISEEDGLVESKKTKELHKIVDYSLSLETELETLRKELENIKLQLQSTKKDNDEMKKKLDEYKIDYVTCKAENEVLSKEIEIKEKLLSNCDKEEWNCVVTKLFAMVLCDKFSDKFEVEEHGTTLCLEEMLQAQLAALIKELSTERAVQQSVYRSIWASFVKNYNENIYDFQQPTVNQRPRLLLGEDNRGDVYVRGLQEICISNSHEALKLFNFRNRDRNFSSTKLNYNSSRSHCLSTRGIVGIPDPENMTYSQVLKLSFCNLASFDITGKLQTTGIRVKETGCIDISLLVFAKCFEQLRLRPSLRNKNFFPFRECKLTRLFCGYFMGIDKAIMIANAGPFELTFDETLHVPRLSAIAKEFIINDSYIATASRIFHSITNKWTTTRVNTFMSSDKGISFEKSTDEVIQEKDELIEKLLNLAESLRSNLKSEMKEKIAERVKERNWFFEEIGKWKELGYKRLDKEVWYEKEDKMYTEELNSDHKRLTEKEVAISELQRELKMEKSKVNSNDDEQIRKIAELTAERDNMPSECRRYKEEISALMDTKLKLEQKLSYVSKLMESGTIILQHELDVTSKDLDDAQLIIKQQKKELENLKTDIKQIVELKKLNDQLKDKNSKNGIMLELMQVHQVIECRATYEVKKMDSEMEKMYKRRFDEGIATWG